jgi:hypothetical protein
VVYVVLALKTGSRCHGTFQQFIRCGLKSQVSGICEYSFARNKILQNHIEYAHDKPSENEKKSMNTMNGASKSEKNEIFFLLMI